MTNSFIPPNSVWPNGMQTDDDGYANFYQLGTNKVAVPTSSSDWPKGNKLISPFVYQDDKLVGFCDTKAMEVGDTTTIVMPYEHIEAEFSSIDKGTLQIVTPKATFKKASWADGEMEDIPEAQYRFKGCKTVADVKDVDSNYLTNDIVDGTWTELLCDLESGNSMFDNCSNLTTFTSDLSSLTYGGYMFNNCRYLTSFTSDLSSLTNGTNMFYNCKLDIASVKNIADTINTYNGTIHIGIGSTTPTTEETEAFNTIASKGWTVYVNGSAYTPSSTAAIMTLDELGIEVETPIPYWAKPAQTDEEHATYIDNEGNFFNILGGQFIYGDDISTYAMFTCEEDAAQNMRLTPYTKNTNK